MGQKNSVKSQRCDDVNYSAWWNVHVLFVYLGRSHLEQEHSQIQPSHCNSTDLAERKENFTNVWLTLELKQVLTTGGRSDTNVTSPFREQSFLLLSKQFPPLSMTETVNSIRVKKHPFLTAYMTLWGLFWSVFESVYSNYIPAGVVYKLSQL